MAASTDVDDASSNGNGDARHLNRPKAMAQRVVDLRSDTVTKPTPKMRAAMAGAEVDDDVLGEDPTARKLQNQVAALLGKQAALLVPSGTMANLICVLAHCDRRGSQVLLGAQSHIHLHEQGGITTLGGVYPFPIRNLPDGTFDVGELETAASRARQTSLAELLHATPRLVCLENSHAACGGRAVTAEHTDQVGATARKHGLAVHLDGARLFNAAVALGVAPERLARAADSVCVCLSKGLGAPAGSVVAGSVEFIEKARRLRKLLGGAMRQVGVLAAAGVVGVRDMAGRLAEDHRRARLLAQGLVGVPGLRVAGPVETNIVYVEVVKNDIDVDKVCEAVGARGVMVMNLGAREGRFRVVTHYHVSDEDVLFAIACFRDVINLCKKQSV